LRFLLGFVGTALFIVGCSSSDPTPVTPGPGNGSTPEEKVTAKIDDLRDQPEELRAFLVDMPKGADLHSHLSGAVNMDKLIQWGAEDGVCVDTTTFTAAAPQAGMPCAAGAVPLSNTKSDTKLYSDVLGAWSLEGFQGTLLDQHQHFFDAFGKFGAVLSDSRTDDSIADVLSTAGKNHQTYVELLQGLSSSAVGNIAKNYIMPGDTWDEAYLLKKRDEIMADPVFKATIDSTKAYIENGLAGARTLLGCGTMSADPGCDVDVRFLVSANRTKDRGYVFAQWVYAYELVQQAPEVVGINLVSPEENANSLLYYDDEMTAIDVLHRFNQKDPARRPVRISLHAGELIKDVLPMTPDGQKHLTYHIRHAVETGHAERIGHGVDVLGETDGDGVQDLLQDMQKANVMVEICLSSNNALLGAAGEKHPLGSYMNADVPVALSTDDQGIFRTDITDEYVRAVAVQGLAYPKLKALVRTSLEHSFLPGDSLWATPNQYDKVVDACAKDQLGAAKPSEACTAFLAKSERATQQWQLETDLEAFEQAAAAK
jgi:adenosine deaminase